MTGRRWLFGLPLLALLALGGVGAVYAPPKDATGAAHRADAVPVQTVVVDAVGSFQRQRTFTGAVKAARTSELGFERTGKLLAVAVQAGDRVARGEVLAQLDTRNLEAKQRELAARRTAARTLLEELEAGPRVQTVAAARAEVRDLEAQQELARINVERRQELRRTKIITQEEFDRTSFGRESIEARLEAAGQRLAELEAGTRPERIEAQRAVVAQLDAALEDVAVELAESTLTSPFDGQVAKRYVDEGTIVSPGAPLLRVVECAALEAWIGLPAPLAATLREDEGHELDVAGRRYAAKVAAVLPELDLATRTRTVVFSFSEAAVGEVVPGQIARVQLAEAVEAEGFWLPTGALLRGTRGLWSALAVEAGDEPGVQLVRRRDLEVLHTDGDRVLVRGTLQAGDRIVAGGTHRIVAGQRVVVDSMDGAAQQARAGQPEGTPR